MVLLAIPAMQAQFAVTKSESMRNMMDRTVQFKNTPVKAMKWGVRPAATPMLRGNVVSYLWDWDSDDSFEGWGSYDYDGDGYGWGTVEDSDAHSGTTYLGSDSYIGGTGPLDPDNWLISPDVTLDGILSIWAMNYSSWFQDQFAVYVCVGELQYLSDFVLVADNLKPGTNWTEYTIDLSEFQGQTGCFAIRHYDSYNQYHLYIDDISIYKPVVIPTPENLTADPDVTSADVAWDDAENAAWNLRYREVVEGIENNLFWGFDEGNNENENVELVNGWTSIDADGDGNGWYVLNDTEDGTFNHHGGIGHVTSASYAGGALTPDNWLVSPEVMLDGTLKFWANGQDPNWAGEIFCVYASTDGENWEPLTEDITATGTPTLYTFDLSGYEGAMGYVAIRHYNVTDKFRLNVDDIEIVYVEEAEWIYVENLPNTEYTIDGLTPETTYEVQVQGINEGGEAGDWTESTVFTTLAPAPETTVAPTVSYHEGVDGDHTIYVSIEANEADCELEYRYLYDGEWSEWLSYDTEIPFTEDGVYVVEGRAKAQDKEWSEADRVEFEITPRTAVNELNGAKAIASVRYFNVAGQEVAQPEGMTIVVTTYSDGTKVATKVVK